MLLLPSLFVSNNCLQSTRVRATAYGVRSINKNTSLPRAILPESPSSDTALARNTWQSPAHSPPGLAVYFNPLCLPRILPNCVYVFFSFWYLFLKMIPYLFSPLSKLTNRAIYCANVFFLYFFMFDFLEQVSQNKMDRSSQKFRD